MNETAPKPSGYRYRLFHGFASEREASDADPMKPPSGLRSSADTAKASRLGADA
jgi:hypothetical protein